jgi:DNA-binding MarR family transcriptional regulator
MNYSKNKVNRQGLPAGQMSIEQFADRMGSLMHKMAGKIFSVERNYLARGVITLPQLWILQEIAGAGQCTMLYLSRNLGFKSSTVTGIMDRLVGLGLVKRYSSQTDRRQVLAELTQKGKRILEQVRTERREGIIKAFGLLSARERADYLAILEKTASGIEAPK